MAGGKRRLSAQLVEDEEYQRRFERVAGIDVGKASAVVCTRLPPARDGGRRASRVETVGASVPEVAALGGRLAADGVEMVTLESTSDYWRIWVRHEAHCLYSPRSGRELEEVLSDLMANQGLKG